ncbi:MAG: MMPL family transporter [Lachnospiraceae bacterium]|nr:MMPL family transporter [Lachnospiraceae bacterium]
MAKIGEWIARCRYLILLIGALLLIPSVIGFVATRVNYDLLSYLPNSLETIAGQDIMVDEFGMGAFTMIVIEGMDDRDIEKLADKIENVEHVEKVLWHGSIIDLSIPIELLPERIKDGLVRGDSTLLVAFLDNTTSSDDSMDAVKEMRKIVGSNCFVSGMTGIVTDIADLCMKELPVYVVIAAILSFLVLELTTESFIVPLFFLLNIGLSILYNLGSNVFLGEISYVTQALTAVMQLAVTMDYSIFLLESYETQKKKIPDNRFKAMGQAISDTFVSVLSSSITTVAGFLALCVMTFALGGDIGIVMSKGVLIGVVTCVTILPSMILVFDKAIEKTKHKPLIKSMDRPSGFVMKHYRLWLLVFLILAFPAWYGNTHTKVYYNIAQSLPKTILSNIANDKLEETFDMNCMHIIMMDKDLDPREKSSMIDEVEEVDGVKWALGLRSVIGPMIPEDLLSDSIREMLQGDTHELAFICSEYVSATDEVNAQLAEINKIVKSHDPTAMVIGEAPMMKDLQDTTDVDLKRVNILSIVAIFIIILFTFKSISLPAILVLVIEFAINVNMAVPYYQGVSLPFVASIVIGTIQLGATVDYAILMTNHYVTRRRDGKDKWEDVSKAHRASMLSIITSGFSFFVATFGVSVYSQVDMIGAICTLLSRGALISMVAVIFILPAMLLVFDGLIIRTTLGFKEIRISTGGGES